MWESSGPYALPPNYRISEPRFTFLSCFCQLVNELELERAIVGVTSLWIFFFNDNIIGR